MDEKDVEEKKPQTEASLSPVIRKNLGKFLKYSLLFFVMPWTAAMKIQELFSEEEKS